MLGCSIHNKESCLSLLSLDGALCELVGEKDIWKLKDSIARDYVSKLSATYTFVACWQSDEKMRWSH